VCTYLGMKRLAHLSIHHKEDGANYGLDGRGARVAEYAEFRAPPGTEALPLPYPDKSTPQKSRKNEQHNEDQIPT